MQIALLRLGCWRVEVLWMREVLVTLATKFESHLFGDRKGDLNNRSNSNYLTRVELDELSSLILYIVFQLLCVFLTIQKLPEYDCLLISLVSINT